MRLRLSHLITVGFGLVISLTIVAALVMFNAKQGAVQKAKMVSETNVPSVILYLEIMNSIERMQLSVFEYLAGKHEQKDYFKKHYENYIEKLDAFIAKNPNISIGCCPQWKFQYHFLWGTLVGLFIFCFLGAVAC